MRCNAERHGWELNKYCTLRWDSRFTSSVVTAVTLKPNGLFDSMERLRGLDTVRFTPGRKGI